MTLTLLCLFVYLLLLYLFQIHFYFHVCVTVQPRGCDSTICCIAPAAILTSLSEPPRLMRVAVVRL